ncbi:hypothetical protein [Sphingomonas faeni]|uniref:hypothetical protein n=1 Tax=Sphingomonas faeni TaxID=185950 RepID=UPI0033646B17
MTDKLEKPDKQFADLEYRTREFMLGLRKLRKREQHASAPDDQQNAAAITGLEVALNRPSQMTKSEHAYVEFVIEELEDFTSISQTMLLETSRGPRHDLFETIISNFRRDMDRFSNDLLLAIRDGQEIHRRIEAS